MFELSKTLSFIFDTGCFILIWLVQLVIYPIFSHLDSERLRKWHSIYTKNVSIVVLPLMLGQLISTTLLTVQNPSWFTIIKSVLVISTWLMTFIIFVPLHNDVGKGLKLESNAKKLVQKNWMRTMTWSVIFLAQISKTLSQVAF